MQRLNIDLQQRNASMRSFFDQKADGFDDVHMALMESKLALTKVLPESTRRVLDLGVGTGMELFALTERFPDVRITGIDISPNMLAKIANRPFAGQVECIVGDFFTVDFGEDYDSVISSASLHHFAPEDKAVLYKRVAAALRPGGLFVNADKFTRNEAETMEVYQYFLTHTERPHNDTPLHTALEAALLAQAGLTDISFTPLSDPGYMLLTCGKPLTL